ncbi:hypothetical protein IAU59_000195 [Kwoniella sp. CBS 9459]
MAPSLSFDAKAPKSPKSPRRFFVFPMPGATSPDGEAVPPLPSLASFTNSRGRKGKHTPSSSISSFSSSSITAGGNGGSHGIGVGGGGGGGFSGATVVRTPQEALEGIRCLSPAPESGELTPRSASLNPLASPMRAYHPHPHPHPQPMTYSTQTHLQGYGYNSNGYGHAHTQSMSASFDHPTFSTSPHSSSGHGHAVIHRSNSAREELRDPTVLSTSLSPATAPMRSAVVGLKGVLKSSSTSPLDAYGLGLGHSLSTATTEDSEGGDGEGDGWARELLSPSLVSALSLGAPLDTSFISTTSFANSDEKVSESVNEENSTLVLTPESTATAAAEGPMAGRWAPLSPVVREKSSFGSLVPPTPAPTSSSYTMQSQSSSRITSPSQGAKRPSATSSSHVRSPSTPSTPSPPTSYIPTHVRAPSSPGPSASTFVAGNTFSKSAPVSKRTSPLTPLSPPIPAKSARRPSLLSQRGTVRPSASTSSDGSKGSAPFPVLGGSQAGLDSVIEFEAATFHATLLSQQSSPLPDAEEDTVLLRFEFAYSLDDPPHNEMLTLPLEILKKGGESRLLSWVEGHLIKEIEDTKSPLPMPSTKIKTPQTAQAISLLEIEGKENSNGNPSSYSTVKVEKSVEGRPRPVWELELDPAKREEKKKSVATVPDMTDGESAEESDLESDNGLSALLRDEYLRSLVIAEPDSPISGHESPAEPEPSSGPSDSDRTHHNSSVLNDETGETTAGKDASTNTVQAAAQTPGRKWTSGFGKRVPGQGKNQYIQLLSRFPLPSFPSSQDKTNPELPQKDFTPALAPPRKSSLNVARPISSSSSSSTTNLSPAVVPVPIPITSTAPSRIRGGRPAPRLELPAKPSFELLSPLQEVAEARLRELRIFLTREAGVWHRIAYRLISGSWGDSIPKSMERRLYEEVSWAGMQGLASELRIAFHLSPAESSGNPRAHLKSKSISPRCGPSPPITPSMWWAEVHPRPLIEPQSEPVSRSRSRSKTLGSQYSYSGIGKGEIVSSQSEGHGSITQAHSQRDMRKQKSMVLKGGKGYI